MNGPALLPVVLRDAFDTIASEHRKFIQDRQAWEFERRELKASVGAMKKEIEVFDRNHSVLAQRIEMLEHALRQERVKYVTLCDKIKVGDQKEIAKIVESTGTVPVVTSGQIKRFDEASVLKSRTMPSKFKSFPFAEGKVQSPGREKLRAMLEQMGYRLPETRIEKKVEEQQKNQMGQSESVIEKEKSIGKTEDESIQREKPVAEIQQSSEVKDVPREEQLEEPTFDIKKISKLKGNMAKKLGQTTKPQNTSKVSISSMKDKEWKQKVLLQNHLDAVRSLSFLPESKALLSASEDCTIKLWNLGKRIPVHTFFGHKSMVTCVMGVEEENLCLSSSVDKTIAVWELPDPSKSPSSPVGDAAKYKQHVFDFHNDIVWGLAQQKLSDGTHLFFSTSADATVGVFKFDGHSNSVLESLEYEVEEDEDVSIIPSSIASIPEDPSKVLVGYRNGDIVVFDAEKGVPSLTVRAKKETWATDLCVHPSNGLAFVGSDDNSIKFIDLKSVRIHPIVL